jgi:hypothetical protein
MLNDFVVEMRLRKCGCRGCIVLLDRMYELGVFPESDHEDEVIFEVVQEPSKDFPKNV